MTTTPILICAHVLLLRIRSEMLERGPRLFCNSAKIVFVFAVPETEVVFVVIQSGTKKRYRFTVAGSGRPEESLPVLRDVVTALYRQKAKW